MHTIIAEVIVRLVIEVKDDNKDTDEVLNEVSAECEYDFIYNENGIRIKDTEFSSIELLDY